MNYTLHLSEVDATLVVRALSQMPYAQVADVLKRIADQIAVQQPRKEQTDG